MIKIKSLIATSIILALTACDGGDEEVSSSANSIGTLEIVGSDFFAGAPLSVSLTDSDGVVDGSITYSWVRDTNGTTQDLSTTSSYVLTEEDEGSVIQVTALYSTESGFFKSENVTTSEIRPTLDVSAFVIKGPVDSATCDIYEIDESGVAGTTSHASAISDTTGAVTFSNVNFAGSGLISCTGGTYTDESTGQTLESPMLRSVVNVVEDSIDEENSENSVVAPDYIVSPVTDLAVQAAAGDFSTIFEDAESINRRFGLRFDTTETLPTVIGEDTLGVIGAEDADLYGAVLALISQLDADSDSDINTLLTDLAADLSDDGVFTTEVLTAFETAQENLDTTSVIADLINEDLFLFIGASVGYNNDPVVAVIGGALSGTINSTTTVPLTGTVTVIDPNVDEDAIVAQTDVTTTYGTFSITAEGSWTYTVDTANATVAALALGESVSESVTITSVDGTTTTIEIRVASLTQVAAITDTGDDTGELRFDVDNLRQGKLSVSLLKEEALGASGAIKDAYITLYGSSGSSSESLIDLRIQGTQTQDDGSTIDPRFFVRNTDDSSYVDGIITAPFVESQFYDVDIAWDLDAAQQITVSIDGEVIAGGAFSTAAVIDSDFTSLDQWFIDGIQTIQFRFSDNDDTVILGSYFVDNIKVYSDTAGTVSVFEDDFESYTAGDTLDGVDSPYKTSVYSEVIAYDPDSAIQTGFSELEGAIDSDTTTATGQVIVANRDADQAFITESTFIGTYGSLIILEDGSWTYTLDTANTTIAALIVGERETETFTISSVDGTTAELIITISGTIVVDTGDNNVAEIRDTLSTDTGELRYKLDDPLFAGRVELSIKRLDDDFGNGDAFIKIFSSSTSDANAILKLRIKDDAFQVDSSSVDVSAATFALNTFMDVVITWEYPDTTATSLPVVTVSIDGANFTADGSTVEFASTATATGGVENVIVSFGGGTATSAATGIVTVDDLVIYSDTAGSNIVFSDDFESYFDGDSLDTDNSASPYNGNTSEATVKTIAGNAGPGTAGNKFATIADTLTDDTGELRYKLEAEHATGSIAFSFKKDETLKTGSTSTKNASVTLAGSSTSSSDEVVQLEIKSSTIVIDDVETTFDTTFTAGTEWVDVLIEWDATTAVADGGVSLKITINDTEVKEVISPLGKTFDIQTVQFRLGSDGDTNSGNFSIDNLVIIGDAGTEVFSDDFESHVVDDVLDGTDDDYNNNSSEATVAEE